MHIENVFNSSRKKVLSLCLGIRNCIILRYCDLLTTWENLHRENLKVKRFPESRYANWNPAIDLIYDWKVTILMKNVTTTLWSEKSFLEHKRHKNWTSHLGAAYICYCVRHHFWQVHWITYNNIYIYIT